MKVEIIDYLNSLIILNKLIICGLSLETGGRLKGSGVTIILNPPRRNP